MRMRRPPIGFLFLAVVLSASVAQAKVYKLYYLGGQSNMDGYGRVNELPGELNRPVQGVMIFHGNTSPDGTAQDGRGVWTPLRPGHGAGFRSDGKANVYADRFGVELTFARTLRKLNPEANIALIKYSRGGTSIDASAAGTFGCWEPDFRGGKGVGSGVNQYDHFLATIRHALAVRDIDGDGEDDTLIPAGILWMQGESDAAHGEAVARRYEANLKRLMDLLRAALRTDDLPVVIGRISDSGQDGDGKVWDHGETVRAAQAAFVDRDGNAALVKSTDGYAYSDRWHYDTAGFIDLGRQFATAMAELTGLRTTVAPDNQLTKQERREGWVLLFDGKTLDGWTTNLLKPSLRPVDEASINPHGCGAYMMIHEKVWGDFKLSMDFKLSPGCNSGIFVRTYPLEPRPGLNVAYNGIEIAVDDTRTAGYHDTGAVYDLVKPTHKAMKSAGQWNRIVVTCRGNTIDVELNGAHVTHADLDAFTEPHKRPDGSRHKFDVAYAKHVRKGYIGLQDHGRDCWYKNIKLLPLGS